MRTSFQHHYERPSDIDVNAALVNATVVLDTNILLGLYRVSPELRETRLSVLRKIGSRLFVPHQVGVEFHRNRRTVVQDISKAYTGLDAVLTDIRKLVKDFGGKNRYEESTKQVRALVEPALDKLLEGLKELAEKDTHRIDLLQDPVLGALEELLEGKVGKAPSPKKLARRVQEFSAVRIPLNLPPGYADARKMDDHGPAAAAGDYLLWREVLTMARRRKTDVVLITDDAKPDWWSPGRISGLPTVPHPLLVSEFREETGHAYYQLSSHDLLKQASALDVTVSDDNLAEEEDLISQRARQQMTATAGANTYRNLETFESIIAAVAAARTNVADYSPITTREAIAAVDAARVKMADYSPITARDVVAIARMNLADHSPTTIREAHAAAARVTMPG